MEWHYIPECSAYKDIRVNYIETLNMNTLHNLFQEEKVTKVDDFLIRIQSWESKMQKEKELEINSHKFFGLMDVINKTQLE